MTDGKLGSKSDPGTVELGQHEKDSPFSDKHVSCSLKKITALLCPVWQNWTNIHSVFGKKL